MFQIDRFGRQPIYEQIIEQAEQLVASGVLKPGDQLPSVRALSQTLSANPNTLQKAYAELERRGITISAPGNGRYITKDAAQRVSVGMLSLLSDITNLAAKLRLAGVPVEQVIAAVEAGYTHNALPETSAPEPKPSEQDEPSL